MGFASWANPRSSTYTLAWHLCGYPPSAGRGDLVDLEILISAKSLNNG